ncbi:MAG: Regulator of RpoS [Phycisphaerae bacterium]|nr:Regulator of RpoS [Phycisphaerae bacterium]
MIKVLIVDDEEGYRRQLQITLATEGYEISTAASGREAIDVGIRQHPDVLISDWMLRNHIHGMHVVEVLRNIFPELRPIVVTGFPSDDLQAEARRLRVCEFIEKPFGRERIQHAVRQAALTPPSKDQSHPLLAILEIDHQGQINYANCKAQAMISETLAGEQALNFSQLFTRHQQPDLESAADHWIAVEPRTRTTCGGWQLRTQPLRSNGTRLIVLRRADESTASSAVLVEMLLEAREMRSIRWPFPGRILVIDDMAFIRQTFVQMLERCGATTYAAGTSSEALRLLQADSGIQYVIHDMELPGIDTGKSIAALRQARPDLVFIGNSSTSQSEQFAVWGVKYFLQKPWRVENLISMLSGQIERCVQCSQNLPLRQAQPGENARTWVCAFCGHTYQAVIDDSLPSDWLTNIQEYSSK